MWTRNAALRLVLLGLGLEVLEGHAQVLAIAVHELDARAGVDRGERRRHERIRGTQHGLPLDAGEVERRQRAARPARHRHRRDPVIELPGGLEARHHVALGPPAGVDHLVDQRVETRAIARVEADREPTKVGDPGSACGRGRCLARKRWSSSCGAPKAWGLRAAPPAGSGNPCAQLANPLRSWCAPASLSDRQDGTDFLAFEFSHDQLERLRRCARGSPRDE